MEQTETATVQPVAIIGMSCRYPGDANNLETFWKLLKDEVDAITEMPSDRLDMDYFYGPERQPGKIITREGGFLSGIEKFDPVFFGISPREATYMDPQQRLLLEVAWEALESAGQDTTKLVGSRTGVFIGIWSSEYEAQMFAASDDIHFHVMLGGARYPAAGRISYAFDFQGPSLIVDTACSSSLVAVHLACQSIWTGEATMALAGGVNLILEPEGSIGGSQSGMLSADGRCRFGDAKAGGYVRSEGVGMVLLKPLAQALADNDPIFAVIRGSAVNSDGRSGGVVSAPGLEAQVAAMHQAYQRAGVLPRQIGYVEAHGTGTPTGDPVEVKALSAVLGQDRPADSPCYLGSVKTNIGHAEPASGTAGLIKAALCLKHRAIPASIHFETPNPDIPWSDLPLTMQTTYREWPQNGSPAFACVNSFGITGTNAHVILQEAPAPHSEDQQEVHDKDVPLLIPLSAHTPQALKDMAQAYLEFVQKDNPQAPFSLSDFGYTRAVRRTHLPYRLALTVRNGEELVEQLEAFGQDQLYQGMSTGYRDADADTEPVFVFTGMGPQWWAMGRELLADEPLFRSAIEECDALFAPLAGWSLVEELSAAEADSRMHQTDVAQSTNFALQVGLAALWRSWGIEPAAIIGHSAGEVAAAYVAGILSLPDAVRVIYHRSRLQHLTTGEGKMLAVGLSPEAVAPYLRQYEAQVSIAAINSPDSITLSGDADALVKIEQAIKEQGAFVRFLQTEVPYHSPKMDRLKAELLEVLSDLQCHPAVIPIYTTVTGQLADDEAYNGHYWWENVRQPVLFAQAVKQAIADDHHVFLELGPHPVLARSILECRPREGDLHILPSLKRNQPERNQLLHTLGTLYTIGVAVAWSKLYPTGQCISLPTYPWQYQSCWFEKIRPQERARPRKALRRQGQLTHPLLGQYIQSALQPNTYLWQVELDTGALPYLKDHRIRDRIVFPATAYIEMATAAAVEVWGPGPHTLSDITLKEALFLTEEGERIVQLVMTEGEVGTNFQFYSRSSDATSASNWVLHATGTIRLGQQPADLERLNGTPEQIQDMAQDTISKVGHYQQMEQIKLQYGPDFQGVQHFWQLSADQGFGRVSLSNNNSGAALSTYHIHPTLLDATFQVLLATALNGSSGMSNYTYLPVGLDAVCFFQQTPAGDTWCRATVTEKEGDFLVGDISLFDAEGEVVLTVQGLRCQKLKRSVTELLNNWLYQVTWPEAQRDAALDLPAATEPGNWLIFADHNGVGQAIADRLAGYGQQCVIVRAGSTWAEESGHCFRLNPAEPADFQRLLQALNKHNALPDGGILYLWGLDGRIEAEQELASLQQAQLVGCGGLLHLLQTMNQVGGAKSPRSWPRLWVITQGAQPIGDNTAVPQVEQASLWGLGRVIALEHTELSVTYFDLDPAEDAEMLEHLLGELFVPDQEYQVGWRQGKRHIARLAPYRIQQPANNEAIIDEDKSYLVTGGLGALGLEVAQWLVAQGARHLVLTGRRGITNDSQREAVEAMEAAGAQVLIATADIAVSEEASRLMQTIQADMPPLGGIFHAAGVIDDGVLHQQTWERFARVLAPKVAGAWNLHRLSQDQPLDFFVCFSSLASMLGSSGQGNYAAGNAFMDALAYQRQALGLPALSLNWGPWAEIGMAARGRKRDQDRWSSLGIGAIVPEEGIQILDALLRRQHGDAQVGIFSLQWSNYWAYVPQQLRSAFFEAFAPATTEEETTTTEEKFRQQLESAPVRNRRSLLIEHLRSQLAGALSLSSPKQIGVRQKLFDLGVDSLIALELRNSLESSLGCALTATFLFDYPTLERLADYLIYDVLDIEFVNGSGANGSPTNGSQANGQEIAVAGQAATDLDSLSPDEIANLLAERLTTVQDGN
jgi:acyl transferase domain-containing protein/acyl carrier protein